MPTTATTAKIWKTEADQLPVHQPTSTSKQAPFSRHGDNFGAVSPEKTSFCCFTSLRNIALSSTHSFILLSVESIMSLNVITFRFFLYPKTRLFMLLIALSHMYSRTLAYNVLSLLKIMFVVSKSNLQWQYNINIKHHNTCIYILMYVINGHMHNKNDNQWAIN